MTVTAEIAPTDRELRAEVPSLEALQHQRRQLVKQCAPLSAKFGGSRGQGSPMDSIRKRHRALIMKSIVVEMRQEWEKPTGNPSIVRGVFSEPAENKLERLANADPRHIQFCDDLEKECARYDVLQDDIKALNEQIQSRLAELYAYNKEIGLQ